MSRPDWPTHSAKRPGACRRASPNFADARILGHVGLADQEFASLCFDVLGWDVCLLALQHEAKPRTAESRRASHCLCWS